MCPNAMDNAQVEEYSDEQVAAAALASLTYGGFATAQSAMDGDNPTRGASHEKTSDLDEVSTTVHTLTDYSSIREIDLAMLAYYTDDHTLHGSLSVYPPVLRKAWMERILDLQRLFYDCGTTRKNSGGVLQPFPEKLMEVLDKSEFEHIVCWMPHGRAFIVKAPQLFVHEVLPKFFKQSKFMSFTRQLNLWGFKRLTRGMDNGAYYHPLFLRGRPLLCSKMKRQKVKVTSNHPSSLPIVEPNFYDTSRFRSLTQDPNPTVWCMPPLPTPYKVPPISDPSMSSYFSYYHPSMANMSREWGVATTGISPDSYPCPSLLFNNMYYSSSGVPYSASSVGSSMMQPCPSSTWNHAPSRYWSNTHMNPVQPSRKKESMKETLATESFRTKWMAERSQRESRSLSRDGEK